ncbi:hypothetical protein F4560_005057 [Saccharothrix ecbatanensis]|uniref:Uncharacterized protein n=1 Tax=Saccharothrix ecbatanensis TaxID=1105145 RepID=A0A7W9M2S4_9PSEU|nr:hypothetical protein [Saccharothrix ecbatanensis]MBB5805289.1 hypothetical protein [Saccharothrix ecbatanensis]
MDEDELYPIFVNGFGTVVVCFVLRFSVVDLTLIDIAPAFLRE